MSYDLLDLKKIEDDLISEINMTPIQAKVYLLLTIQGKMSAKMISKKLGITQEKALTTARELVSLGSLIDMSETEFEAMHPRFTAVNMYRRMCERKNLEFKRNVTVDNIGVALEMPYEDARTK